MSESVIIPLNPTTTVVAKEKIPGTNYRIHKGEMSTIIPANRAWEEDQIDKKNVWIWGGKNEGQEAALRIWQKSVINDSHFLQCLGFLPVQNSHMIIVFEPGDDLLPSISLINDSQLEFAAAVSFACYQLCNKGLEYTQWNTSCVAKRGENWVLLPIGDLRVSNSKDQAAAFEALGKWFCSLKLPFFNTEPAKSIIKMMCQKKIPEDMYINLGDTTFWKKLDTNIPPLKVKAQTNGNTVNLSWDPTVRNVIFRIMDPQQIVPDGMLIPKDTVHKLGDDFREHKFYHLMMQDGDCKASYTIPTDNTKYAIFKILPLVKLGEEWFQPGIPFWIGGPPDIQIYNAWFDSGIGDCVMAFNWASVPDIKSIKILFRTDRHAENQEDFAGINPVIFNREWINHPFRKKIDFPFQLYITVFSQVEHDGRLYSSPGVNSRAIIYKEG